MTILSKSVGILSLGSCLIDIHKTSMIRSKQERQKACADTFTRRSLGCQKTEYLSVKDAGRKNWLFQHGLSFAPQETFGSIKGYFMGVGDGIVRYLPNFILAAFSIIPGSRHKIMANIAAAALGALEAYDFIAHGTNIKERKDYLKN